ncbi:hypothetical protein NHX12_001331 [Muraenolepis orangiensis]|uniref:Uncharacterized protein n=1 Tax=Muraenolepis orangiensis TaxID=630683 RepID=A0A9Q0DY82_9TELE|nr:hypothetical protein NHX12_001331 [Muraenolepis orangiensis]
MRDSIPDTHPLTWSRRLERCTSSYRVTEASLMNKPDVWRPETGPQAREQRGGAGRSRVRVVHRADTNTHTTPGPKLPGAVLKLKSVETIPEGRGGPKPVRALSVRALQTHRRPGPRVDGEFTAAFESGTAVLSPADVSPRQALLPPPASLNSGHANKGQRLDVTAKMVYGR